jgi:aspartyl/glutamyl-tRNA(Asn/Gln) amidotransferase C subunit
MDKKLIEDLATMSALEFTAEECLMLEKDFGKWIEFISPVLSTKLGRDTEGKNEFLFEGAKDIADLRADEVRESLPIDEVLALTSKKRGRYFVVPKVVE